MIDFACKRFSLEEVIKCGLGLTKADFKVFSFLIKNHDLFFTTSDLSKKTNLDLSTVQRSIKRLYEKNMMTRKQENLKAGGYVFYYRIKSKRDIKQMVLAIVNGWTNRVENEFEEWI